MRSALVKPPPSRSEEAPPDRHATSPPPAVTSAAPRTRQGSSRSPKRSTAIPTVRGSSTPSRRDTSDADPVASPRKKATGAATPPTAMLASSQGRSERRTRRPRPRRPDREERRQRGPRGEVEPAGGPEGATPSSSTFAAGVAPPNVAAANSPGRRRPKPRARRFGAGAGARPASVGVGGEGPSEDAAGDTRETLRGPTGSRARPSRCAVRPRDISAGRVCCPPHGRAPARRRVPLRHGGARRRGRLVPFARPRGRHDGRGARGRLGRLPRRPRDRRRPQRTPRPDPQEPRSAPPPGARPSRAPSSSSRRSCSPSCRTRTWPSSISCACSRAPRPGPRRS